MYMGGRPFAQHSLLLRLRKLGRQEATRTFTFSRNKRTHIIARCTYMYHTYIVCVFVSLFFILVT